MKFLIVEDYWELIEKEVKELALRYVPIYHGKDETLESFQDRVIRYLNELSSEKEEVIIRIGLNKESNTFDNYKLFDDRIAKLELPKNIKVFMNIKKDSVNQVNELKAIYPIVPSSYIEKTPINKLDTLGINLNNSPFSKHETQILKLADRDADIYLFNISEYDERFPLGSNKYLTCFYEPKLFADSKDLKNIKGFALSYPGKDLFIKIRKENWDIKKRKSSKRYDDISASLEINVKRGQTTRQRYKKYVEEYLNWKDLIKKRGPQEYKTYLEENE